MIKIKNLTTFALLLTFLSQTLCFAANTSDVNVSGGSKPVKESRMQQQHFQIKEFGPKDLAAKKNDSIMADTLYEHRAHINKIPETLNNPSEILKKYKYSLKDSANNKYVQKLPLKDGDYVILNTKMKDKKTTYAAQYHKDGTLMGIVELIMNKQPRKNLVTIWGHEYRLNDESEFKLKHVIYVGINTYNPYYSGQYIYLADGTLKCYQRENTIYVPENSKKSDNLILEMPFNTNTETTNVQKGLANFSDSAAEVMTASMFTPLFFITFPLVILHSSIDPQAYGSYE